MRDKLNQDISLGFVEGTVPAGTHMCLIFTRQEERTDCLLKFLLSGLQHGERSACFSERVSEEQVRQFLKDNGISYDERKQENAISFAGTKSVYFQDGRFDPDRMLAMLTDYYTQSAEQGFLGARIVGEMDPAVMNMPGGERLLEYESRVSLLVKKYPLTAICQYDATQFDGATLMEILKVHPMMLVNGAVVQNPYFIEPEEYLKMRNIND